MDSDLARRMARLGFGELAFNVDDTFVHPSHGAMRVTAVLGFCDDLALRGHDLKMVKTFRLKAVRDGRKRAEEVCFEVPARDLAEKLLTASERRPK